MENRFKIFFPATISKADENGVIRFKGIASVQSADSAGETIDLNGADLSDFSMVNWNHGKDTGDILGQIDKHELRNGGKQLYVEGSLYAQLDKVKNLVKLEEQIKKNGGKLQLAMSVEGKALMRDAINPKRIAQSRLSGVALTYSPVHKGTKAELILKSFDYNPLNDIEKSEANGGKVYIIDITNPETGMRYMVDKDFNVKIEKAISTTSESGTALKRESLGKKLYPTVSIDSIQKSLIVLAAAELNGKLTQENKDFIKKSNIFKNI